MVRRRFICYSHEDRALFERFRIHLKPYENEGQLEVWTNVALRAGSDGHCLDGYSACWVTAGPPAC